MFATGECRWLKTGFPGQPGRPIVVMGSEMRLCRSLTAFHAWKPPKARIQYRANALPSKLARQGSAAQFLLSFHSIVQCSWPRQLFLGWHCDSGSQSDTESGCKWERDTRRASSAFARPDGRVLGDGCRFSHPPFLSCHKKTCTSVFNALTAREFDPPSIDRRSAVTRDSGSAV